MQATPIITTCQKITQKSKWAQALPTQFEPHAPCHFQEEAGTTTQTHKQTENWVLLHRYM